MRGFSIILIVLIILIFLGILVFNFYQRSSETSLNLTSPKGTEIGSGAKKENMKLSSSAFKNNQLIPGKYTCDGEDISPPLIISEVPEGTKSLVLIVDDPDAPVGNWDHWIVWNINLSTSIIGEGEVPAGSLQGINDFGKKPYGGPCPPSGTHHYYFKLYALDRELELDPSSKKEDVELAIQDHILEQAELIGLYQRQ
jgi:Raf kinase inhibitor-like YbhB/YbcL family protein